ncbi:SETMR methyltransferase, partial [Pseudoatta argentina]
MSIQSPAKCEIRSVIRYLVWKGKTPVEVYNEVKTAYGDKGMNRTNVFKWCREFKNGRTSVHDDQRSGRPSILTDDIVENIENALRGDRRLTVDELSAMFPQISRSLLHETITETLGYRKLSARWVPKQLTDQHKLNRVEAGQEFLRRYKLHGDEFLRSIVTGDETWVEKTKRSLKAKSRMSRLSRSKRKEIFRLSMKVARWIQRRENVRLPHGMFWNKFSHSSVGQRVGSGREVVVQSNRPLPAILWPLTPESRPMPKGGCNKG